MDRYIDCHVHLDLYDYPDQIISEYEKRQIYAFFVTFLPELFERSFLKVQRCRFVRMGLGYHPEMVREYPFQEDIFKKYIGSAKYLGEIGLDFSKKNEPYKDEQMRIFETILTYIGEKPKLLSLHSRCAEKTIIDLLFKYKVKHTIFHWYTGPVNLIRTIAEQGYYFSVNPKMMKSDSGRKIIGEIPLSQLLVETDGPFVNYDKKTITPMHIPQFYEDLERFLGTRNLKSIVYNNFRTMVNRLV